MATPAEVQQLFITYFGRPADPSGVSFWTTSPGARDATLTTIANGFASTPEYANTVANLTLDQIVNNFYVRLFGRQGEVDGIRFWVTQIQNGNTTPQAVGLAIGTAAQGTDLTARDSKIVASAEWTTATEATTNALLAYSGNAGIQAGVTFLAPVVSTETIPTPAQTAASIATLVAENQGGGGGGQTFTLTTNADTATANVFNSNVQVEGAFALNTLNNGDRLTGTGTNPTLNATLNTTGGIAIAPALLSGINTANFDFTNIGGAAGAAALNFQNATGISTVAWNSATAASALTGLSSALANLSIANTAAAQTFTFTDAALAGTADTLRLNASSVTGGNAVNLNTATAGAATSNYETVSIASSGVIANAFNIAQNSGGLTTLNVTGEAAFTTANTSANLTTFNASSATGIITYTEGGAVGNASYTTGTANDTIDLVGTLTVNDTVNGGDGTDTLRANIAAIDSGTFATAANTANITGIEVLSINNAASGGTGIVNANLFTGVNSVTYRVAAGGNVTLNTPSGAFTVNDNVAGGIAGNFTVDAAGTGLTDALTFVADSGGAGAVAYGGNITFTDYETVTWNITDPAGATVAGTFQVNPNIGASSTLNITGVAGPVFTGAVTASTLNASALTTAGIAINGGMAATSNVIGSGFADSILGSAANDIISGGAGNDTLQGGGGQDSISLGAGQDRFQVRSVTANGTALNSIASGTAVNDFVTGLTAATTDTIQIGIAAASVLTNAAGTVINPANATANPSVLAVASGSTINIAASTANIIKLVGSTSTTAANTGKEGFSQAMNGATLTVGLAANDDLTFVYYDSANQQAVLGIINDTSGALIQSANADDVWTTLGKISMTAADYANLNTINFAAFIA